MTDKPQSRDVYEIVLERFAFKPLSLYTLRKNGEYILSDHGGGTFLTKWGAKRALKRILSGETEPKVVHRVEVF